MTTNLSCTGNATYSYCHQNNVVYCVTNHSRPMEFSCVFGCHGTDCVDKTLPLIIFVVIVVVLTLGCVVHLLILRRKWNKEETKGKGGLHQ